jgi:hypothetical protein
MAQVEGSGTAVIASAALAPETNSIEATSIATIKKARPNPMIQSPIDAT